MNRETIFLFTSERERQTTGSWFSMYINPEQLSWPWKWLYQKQNTAGGFVFYHWRPDIIKLDIQGKSGWILKPSMLEELSSDLYGQLKSKSISKWGGPEFWGRVKQYGSDLLKKYTEGAPISDYDLSPRNFIKRLREIVQEDMFVTVNGIEIYNWKYLHVFTKQYPEGKILKGFSDEWSVSEDAKDAQLISYKFGFIVQGEEENTETILDFAKKIAGVIKK